MWQIADFRFADPIFFADLKMQQNRENIIFLLKFNPPPLSVSLAMTEFKAGPGQFEVSCPSGESNPSILGAVESNTNQAQRPAYHGYTHGGLSSTEAL